MFERSDYVVLNSTDGLKSGTLLFKNHLRYFTFISLTKGLFPASLIISIDSSNDSPVTTAGSLTPGQSEQCTASKEKFKTIY